MNIITLLGFRKNRVSDQQASVTPLWKSEYNYIWRVDASWINREIQDHLSSLCGGIAVKSKHKLELLCFISTLRLRKRRNSLRALWHRRRLTWCLWSYKNGLRRLYYNVEPGRFGWTRMRCDAAHHLRAVTNMGFAGSTINLSPSRFRFVCSAKDRVYRSASYYQNCPHVVWIDDIMTSLSSHSRMSFSPSNLRVLKLTLSSSGTQISEISMANSRQNIRKLVKDGFVIRKPQKVWRCNDCRMSTLAEFRVLLRAHTAFPPQIHSRARTLRGLAAKRLGRHTGYGMCAHISNHPINMHHQSIS